MSRPRRNSLYALGDPIEHF